MLNGSAAVLSDSFRVWTTVGLEFCMFLHVCVGFLMGSLVPSTSQNHASRWIIYTSLLVWLISVCMCVWLGISLRVYSCLSLSE